MKKATRRVWSILLVCFMLLTMLPAGVWAADDEVKKVADSGALIDAFAQGGEIQLTGNIEIVSTVVTDENVLFTVSKETVLDLNGHTLSYKITEEETNPLESEVFIQVLSGGKLTVIDSDANGTIAVKETAEGTANSNKVIGAGIACVEVRPGGSFILESGTLEIKQLTHEAT